MQRQSEDKSPEVGRRNGSAWQGHRKVPGREDAHKCISTIRTTGIQGRVRDPEVRTRTEEVETAEFGWKCESRFHELTRVGADSGEGHLEFPSKRWEITWGEHGSNCS